MKHSILLCLGFVISASAFAEPIHYGHGIVDSEISAMTVYSKLLMGQEERVIQRGKGYSVTIDKSGGRTQITLKPYGEAAPIVFDVADKSVRDAGDGKGSFVSGRDMYPKQTFNIYLATQEIAVPAREQSFCARKGGSDEGVRMVRAVKTEPVRSVSLRFVRADSSFNLDTEFASKIDPKVVSYGTNNDGKFQAAGPCQYEHPYTTETEVPDPKLNHAAGTLR